MNFCLDCLGCLGLRRYRRSQDPETSRLLYDDPYRSRYGTNGTNAQRVIDQQPDPAALRREREEMEGICHRMSDQVIDVFKVAPQEDNILLTARQIKEIVMKYRVHPAKLADPRVAAMLKKRLYETKNTSSTDPREDDEVPQGKGGPAIDKEPTSQEELGFKTIRRKRREPLTIPLDRSESEAVQAVMG